ncbi:hypothetical protein O6R16_05555 [Candidatus Rickettsia tasmanensis]
MLTTAKALLDKNFNIVIDTALDGPDAQELAKFYLKYLNGYKITFLGIFCPVEERLKTRTDNLFLTEDFVRLQSGQYDVFESCRNFYNTWFYSSKLWAIENCL